jgi:hypothetical protein
MTATTEWFQFDVEGWGQYTWRTDMDRAQQVDMLDEILAENGWDAEERAEACKALGMEMARHDAEASS